MTHGITPSIIFKRIDDFAQEDLIEQADATNKLLGVFHLDPKTLAPNVKRTCVAIQLKALAILGCLSRS